MAQRVISAKSLNDAQLGSAVAGLMKALPAFITGGHRLRMNESSPGRVKIFLPLEHNGTKIDIKSIFYCSFDCLYSWFLPPFVSGNNGV